MNTTARISPNAAALMLTLTPTQVRALKLAKDGDLYPQDSKKWAHLNAAITYAKSDRFKERPIKIKTVTTATLVELRDGGLLDAVNLDVGPDVSPHAITMAGKMWLLKHK